MKTQLTIDRAVSMAREANRAIVRASWVRPDDGLNALVYSTRQYRDLLMRVARERKETLRLSREALEQTVQWKIAEFYAAGSPNTLVDYSPLDTAEVDKLRDQIQEAQYQLHEFLIRHAKELGL